MKKTTFLLFLFYVSGMYAQCIRTEMFPYTNIISNNLGSPQLISDCSNTNSFAQVNNIVNNVNYQFTCKTEVEGVHKYITVTNLSDVVIAQGLSPLNVSNITVNKVKVHYSENEGCDSNMACVVTKIQALLPCPAPVNLQASGITTSNVNFTWDAGGAETSWEVLVLTSGSPAPTAATSGTMVANTPEYTYSELEPQGHYRFYVRSNCGGDGFSPWNGPLNFDSACIAVDDFFQNFNTTPYNTMPDCWSKIIRGQGVSVNANITAVTSSGNAGTNCILINNANSSLDSDLILVSPNVGNLSAGTHRLKFFIRSYNENSSIEIGTLSSTTNTAVFTVVDEVEAGVNFTEKIIDFTSYAGTDQHIGFRFKAEGMYSNMFIDDIRWEFAPLCLDVTNITVPSSTINSVTLAWNPEDDIQQWDVVYGDPSETDPTTLIPISPAPTESTATITGLLEHTSYKAWVRSTCGTPTNYGAWIGPVSFTTACAGVSDLNEGFENVTEPDLPNCWSSILRGEYLSSDAGVKVMNYGPYAGMNAVVLNNNESGNLSDIILVTPHLSNLSEGTHRLKFFADGDMPSSIEVGTLNSNTQNSVFTVLEQLSITSSYNEYVVDFTSYTGTDTNIGFRISSNDYTTLFMDNIRWELAPLCPDVLDINVPTVTVDSATVNWEAGGLENQWEVVVGDISATDPNTLVPVSPSPITTTAQVTGLSESTTYKVWVRAICGVPYGNGAWIGPVFFTTECLPTTVLNENFDAIELAKLPACWTSIVRGEFIAEDAKVETVNYNADSPANAAALINSYSADQFDIILVSPKLNNSSEGTHRLKFSAKAYSEGALQVGTLDGNTQTAVFTPLKNIEITDSYVVYTVDFTEYEGGDPYIGIRHNSPSMHNTIFIDNVVWEVAPLCPDVLDIEVQEKTTTTANIVWANIETADWQIVYGASSVTDPNTLTPSELLTSPNTQIVGLEAFTAYNVWVRTVCGEPNGNGAWIGPISFTTDCLPATTLEESFETAVNPELPNCWSSIIRGESVNGFINTIAYQSFEGSQAINMSNLDSTGEYDVILVSPSLSNLAAGTHQLKLSATAYSECNLEIGTLSSNYIDAVFTPLPSAVIPVTGEYEEHVIDFSGYTGTDTYIGFRHSATTIFTSIFLDKISWEPLLGNKDVEGTAFNYYPNPVEDVLHLSYGSTISNATLFNMLGQKVAHHDIDDKKAIIDMSRLSTGTYVLRVTSGNEIKTFKIMKK